MAAPAGVDAPGPGTRGPQVEEHDAEKDREVAAVENRPPALRPVRHELIDLHVAAQAESDRAAEQPDEQQQADQQIRHFTDHRIKRCVIRHDANWPGKGGQRT